jgi:hypothetical protein
MKLYNDFNIWFTSNKRFNKTYGDIDLIKNYLITLLMKYKKMRKSNNMQNNIYK